MAVRLLPLSVAELCAHALLLEDGAATRYREYAERMRDRGAGPAAEDFEDLEREKRERTEALEAASEGRKLPELSPWEYAWRLTYFPDALAPGRHVVPQNAREALQLALAAERRAEHFYGDVAENARDAAVRVRGMELAVHARRHVQHVERLLAGEILAAWGLKPSGAGDIRLLR